MFSSAKGQVGSPAKLLNSFRGHTVPLIHVLQYLHLVGLKDGHSVESRTCLSCCHVGLTDQSGGGPTQLRRKERVEIGERCTASVSSITGAAAYPCSTEPTRLVKSAAAALVSRRRKAASKSWRSCDAGRGRKGAFSSPGANQSH